MDLLEATADFPLTEVLLATRAADTDSPGATDSAECDPALLPIHSHADDRSTVLQPHPHAVCVREISINIVGCESAPTASEIIAMGTAAAGAMDIHGDTVRSILTGGGIPVRPMTRTGSAKSAWPTR